MLSVRDESREGWDVSHATGADAERGGDHGLFAGASDGERHFSGQDDLPQVPDRLFSPWDGQVEAANSAAGLAPARGERFKKG